MSVLVFLLACGASLALTALVRKVAPGLGLTDHPDGHRKLHQKATPLGGGIAVFLATAGVLGVLLAAPDPWNLGLRGDWPDVLTLLLACSVIAFIGLVDDRWGLRGRHKLIGQVLAATILMGGGLLIQRVAIFGWKIDLGPLTIPVTLLWLVGAINAVNLLDGIDGLATTLGVILSGTICVMAAITHHTSVAIIALVFAGSLLGFLRFNFPPASIFLGDAGSMLIGLVVGALAIRGSLKGPGTVLLAAPLAAWTIPILDSVAAVVRRKLTGRSIYSTDRGHLHHRLLDRLGSNRKVLALIAISCAVTSAAALGSLFLKHDLIALTTCAAIVVIFSATDMFGRVELLLLASRLRSVGLTLMQPIARRQSSACQTAIRLQGSRQWELLWSTLIESADKLGLRQIHFDVNLPIAQEAYNATWRQLSQHQNGNCWRMELPLVVADQAVGHLKIMGQCNGEPVCQVIGRLIALLQRFETELLILAGEQALCVPIADDGRRALQKEEAVSSSAVDSQAHQVTQAKATI